ncbi:flavin-dependent thymidylate synthase [Spirochaetia bacterium]|nr:flavin-dependent thymidylate synthase [Spirochaetia bacterium]GHU29429.1 flavin-dependent thymidylate synthase [Spirochaetia bacterium]
MAHCRVPEADAILDHSFPVLDKGCVRLVDYLGGDERIVQVARISYASGARPQRDDSALIDHLMHNRHLSPFEQVVLTFYIKLPIFVARQWVRHRTARINEVSGRYSILGDEFYLPSPEDLSLEKPEEVIDSLRSEQKNAYEAYNERLKAGIPREIARINLPLSVYTQWYWQIDLRNLFHFLQLRLDTHAQREIRRYAEVVLDITRTVAPHACESFTKYRSEGYF